MKAADVTIGKHVQITGRAKNLFIDSGTTIGDHVWLNVSFRDDMEICMKIGRCVLIGRQSMISTGGYLEIGDFCLFAPRVYVSDLDHIFSDPNQPILQQGATFGRSVIIEENCWLGINVVVTGNVTVGRGSVVAANSTVLKDVPPFSVVAGNPAKITKMYNAETKSWERIKNDEDIRRVLHTNNQIGLPSREEYRTILTKNAKISKIDPILAGPKLSFLSLAKYIHRSLINKQLLFKNTIK